MPVPQENLSIVEQARCLFFKYQRKMPVPQENSIFVEQARCLFIKRATGKMPVPQENSIFVEQASCLFIISTQDACSTRTFYLCGTGILPVL